MEKTGMESQKPLPINRQKNGLPLGVTINHNGTLTVDPAELLKQPEVQRQIEMMAEIEESQKAE